MQSSSSSSSSFLQYLRSLNVTNLFLSIKRYHSCAKRFTKNIRSSPSFIHPNKRKSYYMYYEYFAHVRFFARLWQYYISRLLCTLYVSILFSFSLRLLPGLFSFFFFFVSLSIQCWFVHLAQFTSLPTDEQRKRPNILNHKLFMTSHSK